MDRFQLQKLRDLPIEGIAERLGLRVTRGHKSLCPFHEDHHASLSYSIRKNSCRCFVCMNESMGTIDLVMKHLRMDFKDACKWLADENNIILDEWKANAEKVKEHSFDPNKYERFFARTYLSDEARKFLFGERLLDPRVISWCRVGSWRDRNGISWLQIPYYDMERKLIGVQNRNLGPKTEDTPRFRFPPGSRCTIYNLPIIKHLKHGDELWIAEGCSDAWSLLCSAKKAIAIPSATLLSPADKELLSSLSSSLSLKWSMYPDKDAPGERLFLQLKEILPNLEHHQLPIGCKDYSDYFVSLRKSGS